MNNVFRGKFPSWSMILSLSPRELAYEIALGMNAKMAQGGANINWEANGLAQAIASAYADTKENRRIIMEGIQMMFTMGLITESGTRGDPYIYLTRAGIALDGPDAVAAHRARVMTAQEILDPQIVNAVWSAYLRGDYDIAIAYSFKRVEVAMREKGGYSAGDFGERLIKRFFGDFRLPGSPDGPKPSTLTPEEQMFIGALGIYRNPASHEDTTIENPERAMEVLLLSNHLLHLVRSAALRSGTTVP